MFGRLVRSAKESLTLWLLGALFLIVGIGLILGAHKLQSGYVLFSETLRDVGIALCISVFIAFLIEVGLAHRMFENGLNAIMRQTVPPEVWNEIRQNVISQPVIQHDWHITMKIEKGNTEYISTTTLHYVIESLRDVWPHQVHHELDLNRNPVTPPGNRYEKISVDSKPVDLQKAVSTDKLKADFEVPFIGHGKKKKVSVRFSERVSETDIITWWMSIATIGLSITVTVPDNLNVTVSAHHPVGVFQVGVKGHWVFKGVMLPGQGFEIQLTPKT
jgi:hypothetical protein